MSWTRCLPAEIHGIMPAQLRPHHLDGVGGALLLQLVERGRPDSDSAIHSSANLPLRISSRIARISAFTAPLITAGPG